MKDFKSHEDSEIEFSQGLNIFLGEVGAGKTSILEAISFALFGRYAGSINQTGLIRRGAEKAEISLTFSTNSARFKVDRRIDPEKAQQAKMSVYDEEEWKLAVEGAIAVNKSIEDLLNVDASTFLAAIYASQSEIKEMLETQPGKRRERLDKLLGIDMYEKIWKTLGDVGNIVLKELTQAQDKASGVDVLEKQLQESRSHITRYEKEWSGLQNSLEQIDQKLEPTERLLKDLTHLKQELTKVETQIEGKVKEIEKSTETLKILNSRQKMAEKAASLFERNKIFIDREKELEEEKRRVENVLQKKKSFEDLLQRDERDLKEEEERRDRLTTVIQKLKALEEEVKLLETERSPLPRLMEEKTELEGRIDEVKVELVKTFNEIENQKGKVKRVIALGECPTCLQTVPDEHKARISEEFNEIIRALEAEYMIIKDSNTKASQQLEELERKMERAEAADRQYVLKSTQAQILEGRRGELTEVEAKINEIKLSIADEQQKIGQIRETAKNLQAIDKKLEEVTSKANLAREAELQSAPMKDLEVMVLQEERKIEALNLQLYTYRTIEKEIVEKYNVEEHAAIDSSVRTLREERAKHMEGISRLEETLREYKLQIEQVNRLLDEKREAKKKVDALKNESNIVDRLRQSLRQVVQPLMRKNNVLSVSEAFQSFYQELSNDTIDYASIDEDGNIEITRNGEPSPVNSLSGGETTCAALALRLAICSALTKNQLLLLDEPTIHLDELYRAKLRDFLGYHRFEQLIVVTHDNTFDALPAKIFRVEKGRGESVVSPLRWRGG